MVGPIYDCVENPLGAVRLTFEKALSRNEDALDDKDWGAIEVFRHFLFDQSVLAQVPIMHGMNVCRIPPKTLVRFRGMIQDMLGKEFYVGAYKDGEVWRTSKYSDATQYMEENSFDQRVWERRLLYCVPIPGISEWANLSSEESVERYLDSMSQKRDKRNRTDVGTNYTLEVSANEEDLPGAKKMRAEGSNHSVLSNWISSKPEIASTSTAVFSDASVNQFSCLVKIYDTPDHDLKLDEVYEFIGVLDFGSGILPSNDCTIEHENMEINAPLNEVPRLHCILQRKLAMKDLLTASPYAELQPNLNSIREIRDGLLKHLTCVLGNDGLTAHFLLLHLLSSVHARVDNIGVGKLALNITGLNRECASVFGNQLDATIKSLLPITECVPLTIKYLNDKSLAPRKDYDADRMIPGSLSLVRGSHLMFDETTLEAGTLNSVGIENAQLLKNITENQKVDYDFVYYKLAMPVDVQVLILSEGRSNILPADVEVPFHPSGAAGGASQAPTEESLAAWRWYLATMRSMPHAISPDVQKAVEDDLVAARRADQRLNVEDFSRWLTMGRLICASFGETTLSMEHWHLVKETHRLRCQRLP